MKLKLFIVFLCAVIVCGALGWMTSGFQKWGAEDIGNQFTEATLNKDNKYSSDNMTIKSSNDGNGIIVEAKDNGTVKFKGKNNTDDVMECEIGSVTLDKGTYTFTAIKGAAKNTMYASLLNAGSLVCNADFTGNTFTVAADATELTIVVYIQSGAEVDATVYPVIVEGEEAGSFFG